MSDSVSITVDVMLLLAWQGVFLSLYVPRAFLFKALNAAGWLK